MDVLTLLTVNLSVAAIMALAMIGLYLSNRHELCLAHWALAGTSFFANSLLSLVHTLTPLPYWLGPPLGNLLLVSAYLFFFSGIRHYLKLPVRLSQLLGILLVVYSLNMTAFAREGIEVRVLLNFPLLIAFNLLTLRSVLQARLTQMRGAVILFFVVMAANMLQLSLRFVVFLLQYVGVIQSGHYQELHSFGSLAVLLFMLCAMTSCMLLLVRQKTLQLQQQVETDPLTDWLNRQSLQARLQAEWHRSVRLQQPLSLIIFDIDHFKQINDRFGHQCGDQVLKQVSQLAAAELRGYDLQFRIGGEEFLVCLPQVSRQQLQCISERIRSAIASAVFAGPQQVTVSIGYASSDVAPLQHWNQLYEMADQALYQAKAQGRNRVACGDTAAQPLRSESTAPAH